MSSLRGVLDAGADLLFGARCPGCGAPGFSLCAACERALAPRPAECARRGLDVPIWAGTTYDGPLRRVLPAYKDQRMVFLAKPLSRLLAAAIEMALAGAGRPDVLVPMPSTAASARERGFDHAAKLAVRAGRAAAAGTPVHPALRRSASLDQAGLSQEARRANLRHALRSRRGRGDVLICDDLVTTGASAVEAARALRAAGWRVLGVAACAQAPRLVAARSQRRRAPGARTAQSGAAP